MFKIISPFILAVFLMGSSADANEKNITKTDFNLSIENNRIITKAVTNHITKEISTSQKNNILSKQDFAKFPISNQSKSQSQPVPIMLLISLLIFLFIFYKGQNIKRLVADREKLIAYIGIKYLMRDESINNKRENEDFGTKHELNKDSKNQLESMFEWFTKNKERSNILEWDELSSTLNKLLNLTFWIPLLLGLFIAIVWFGSHNGKNPIGFGTVTIFAIFPALTSMISLYIVISWYRKEPSKLWKQTNPIWLIKTFFNNVISIIIDHVPTRWLPSWQNEKKSIDPKYDKYRAIINILDDNVLKNWLLFSQVNKVVVIFGIGSAIGILLISIFGEFTLAWTSMLKDMDMFWYGLFKFISLPWSWFWEGAVPTGELIKCSNYSNIGSQGIAVLTPHAELLKNWWKFIFMTMLFYGVILRLFIFALSIYKLESVLDNIIIADTAKLWRQMSRPTTPPKVIGEKYNDHSHIGNTADANTAIIGWELKSDRIAEVCNKQEIVYSEILDEDSWEDKILTGDVYVFIRASEEPTGDILSMLNQISDQVGIDDVTITFIRDEGYTKIQESVFEIWEQEIKSIGRSNIKIDKSNISTCFIKDVQIINSEKSVSESLENTKRTKSKEEGSNHSLIENTADTNTLIIGWELKADRIREACEKQGILYSEILDEDSWEDKILTGDIYVFIRASEEPTGDILSMLNQISDLSSVDDVTIVFILDEGYVQIPESVFEIWEQEIKSIGRLNIKVKK